MKVEGSYSVCFFPSNLAGSLSTLTTNSLSERQEVTATLLPTSLPTKYSPERLSFTATVAASTNVSATSLSQTLQQPTSEHNKLSTLATAAKGSLNQSFTTVVSMNTSTLSSLQSSSKVPVVTTSYMALPVTPRSSTPGQSDFLILSAVSSQSPRFAATAATGNASRPLSSQILSSREVSVQTLATAVKGSLNQSYTTTVVSVNTSTLSSVLVQSSSKVPVVTTSDMTLPVTLRSSTLGQSDLLTLSAVSSQSPRSTATAATGNASRPLSSQMFSSSEVSFQSASYMASSSLSSTPFSSALEKSNSLMQTRSVASGTSPTPSSPVQPLLTANASVEASPNQSATIAASMSVSATPSLKSYQSSEFTTLNKSSPTITSSASDQIVVVTQISRLGTSQSQTFTAASVLTTATASSVNFSMKASSQMTFSSNATISATGTSPVTQSSSVPVIPPGTFVRFVISVPLNQSVNESSFRANLTRGILTAYEKGTLDGITESVSVNVSKRNQTCGRLSAVYCVNFAGVLP